MTDYRALSLWWDGLRDDVARRAPLDGDSRADVAIVGGGYTGLWTAYYLLSHHPGLDVMVIERETCGFGASGRNGGWCSALFPVGLDAMARRSSRADAVRMLRAMHATVDEVGAIAAAEGLDIGWSKGGTLTLARSDVQLQRIRDAVDHWHSWGFGDEDYAFLDADAARARLNATDVRGASYSPHCAAIDPARLVRGLADIVTRLGGRIVEGTAVAAINPGEVITEHGRVLAPFTVRATEGYTASLAGQRRTIAPVYSLMIATEPLPDHVWDEIGLPERATFADERHLIVYGQRTADGRLAFGGRGAPYHLGSAIRPDFDRDSRVHERLWHELVDLLPIVKPYAVTHAWGGPLGIPRDWFPSCGVDTSTGMAWGGGYVGDGVGAANLAGRTIADLILGRDTDITSLPWVNHRSPRWEPEPLRWAGINGMRAAVASADGAETRTGRPSRVASLVSRLTGH